MDDQSIEAQPSIAPTLLNVPPIHQPSIIYKATYSGVPVWEMRCKGIAVMRRKSDSWLNATQILKVAEFDKPHRTRILEREVQKGEHEKVQGGYGKYQGTWVPYQTGVDLAERYKVKELLQAIFDFVPSSQSPPLAPKHITAASNKPRKPREPKEPKAIKPKITKKKKQAVAVAVAEPEIMMVDTDLETNDAISPTSPETHYTQSDISSIASTPAAFDSSNDMTESDDEIVQHNKNKKRRLGDHGGRPPKITKMQNSAMSRHYGELLLKHFTTNSPEIPEYILNPLPDFDPNVIIDTQGHTPLHWCAAMGNLKLAEILIDLGARLDAPNVLRETPLMRAVMFSYNYEHRVFPAMLDLLLPTINNVDNNDQTVLHHIAIYAGSRGKVSPSKYYMEIILNRLFSEETESYRMTFINMKNIRGDTTLNIAARNANKKLVKLLVDAGGDPQIRNNERKNAEDYILELDAEAQIRAFGMQVGPLNGFDHNLSSPVITGGVRIETRHELIPNANHLLKEFQDAYEEKLHEKDNELLSAQSDLASAANDLQIASRDLENLKAKTQNLPNVKERIEDLKRLLHGNIESRRAERLKQLYEEEIRKNVNVNIDSLSEVSLRKELAECKQRHSMLLDSLKEVKINHEARLLKYKLMVQACTGVQPQKIAKKMDVVLDQISPGSSMEE